MVFKIFPQIPIYYYKPSNKIFTCDTTPLRKTENLVFLLVLLPGNAELLGRVLPAVAHVELVVDVRQPVADQPVLQVNPAVGRVPPDIQRGNHFSCCQCCGTEMFIPNPTFFHPASRILDPNFSIPNPGSATKNLSI